MGGSEDRTRDPGPDASSAERGGVIDNGDGAKEWSTFELVLLIVIAALFVVTLFNVFGVEPVEEKETGKVVEGR